MKKSKFYFTFGTDPQFPYEGGWVEVVAEDANRAIELFTAKYPERENGNINCAFFYPEEFFKKTLMPSDGNFGAYCHEVIEEEEACQNKK